MAAIPQKLLDARSMRLASTLSREFRAPSRPCDWPDFDQLLPDGGLPHAVVEITCAHALFAGATRVAVAAVCAAHQRDARGWCAWIDSESTLYAPGLARAGVDLTRLLVLRTRPEMTMRVTVKVATSGAFDVVIVELPRADQRLHKLVRKLALSAEQHGTSIVLLAPPHTDPWPVALRLEIVRTEAGLEARVTKDRFGRVEPRLAKTHVPIALVSSMSA